MTLCPFHFNLTSFTPLTKHTTFERTKVYISFLDSCSLLLININFFFLISLHGFASCQLFEEFHFEFYYFENAMQVTLFYSYFFFQLYTKSTSVYLLSLFLFQKQTSTQVLAFCLITTISKEIMFH